MFALLWIPMHKMFLTVFHLEKFTGLMHGSIVCVFVCMYVYSPTMDRKTFLEEGVEDSTNRVN